jgi:hypothetical protein
LALSLSPSLLCSRRRDTWQSLLNVSTARKHKLRLNWYYGY